MSISRLEEWYADCERDSAELDEALVLPHRTPMSSAERREYSERLAYVATPTDADLAWLSHALRSEKRKWFVAHVAGQVRTLPESLLAPMLDAAVDEIDPS